MLLGPTEDALVTGKACAHNSSLVLATSINECPYIYAFTIAFWIFGVINLILAILIGGIALVRVRGNTRELWDTRMQQSGAKLRPQPVTTFLVCTALHFLLEAFYFLITVMQAIPYHSLLRFFDVIPFMVVDLGVALYIIGIGHTFHYALSLRHSTMQQMESAKDSTEGLALKDQDIRLSRWTTTAISRQIDTFGLVSISFCCPVIVILPVASGVLWDLNQFKASSIVVRIANVSLFLVACWTICGGWWFVGKLCKLLEVCMTTLQSLYMSTIETTDGTGPRRGIAYIRTVKKAHHTLIPLTILMAFKGLGALFIACLPRRYFQDVISNAVYVCIRFAIIPTTIIVTIYFMMDVAYSDKRAFQYRPSPRTIDKKEHFSEKLDEPRPSIFLSTALFDIPEVLTTTTMDEKIMERPQAPDTVLSVPETSRALAVPDTRSSNSFPYTHSYTYGPSYSSTTIVPPSPSLSAHFSLTDSVTPLTPTLHSTSSMRSAKDKGKSKLASDQVTVDTEITPEQESSLGYLKDRCRRSSRSRERVGTS